MKKTKQINGDELKQVREGWQMTQAEFAALLGASVRTYEGWEAGRAIPGHVAEHVRTIGKLRRIYAHWDKIAQAILRAGGTALTGEDIIAAINEADELSDKHEGLWAKLFPVLNRE